MKPLAAGDPRTVGRYRLLAELGRGGMGRVLLASAPDGQLVALKQIRDQFADDDGFRARFRREVAASRKVSGTYTAAVVDADPDAQTPWLASVFVPGPSLREAVDVAGVLPEEPALRLAAGLAAALVEIHRAGLVHRDLKPSNVLLAADGPRVIDFGIARATDSQGGTEVTHTGWLVGAPGFMSPEQAEGRPVTPASDMFSLGTVLFAACTGKNPFDGPSTPQTLFNVVYGEPDLSAVPGRVRRIAERCLAKDPADRPTPTELLESVGQVAPAPEPWPPAVQQLIGTQQSEVARLVTEATERTAALRSVATVLATSLRQRTPGEQPTRVQPDPPGDRAVRGSSPVPAGDGPPDGADPEVTFRFGHPPVTVPPQPKKPRTGLLVGIAAGALALVLLVCGVGSLVLRSALSDADSSSSGSNTMAGTDGPSSAAGSPTSEDTYSESPTPSPTAREPDTLDDEDTDETPLNDDQFFPDTIGDYERAASGEHSACSDAGGDATDSVMNEHGCGRMVTADYLDTDNGLMASAMVIPLPTAAEADAVGSAVDGGSDAFNQLTIFCPHTGTGSDLCDSEGQARTYVFHDTYHRYMLLTTVLRLDGSDTPDDAATDDLGGSVMQGIRDQMLVIQ